MNPVLIDRAHLTRQTGGDAAFADEILALFSGHAPEAVAKLASAATDRAWRDAAHSLKGTARGIGAMALGDAAAAAEGLAPGDPAARSALEAIERLLALTLREIEGVGSCANSVR